jgi:hypothetical protein
MLAAAAEQQQQAGRDALGFGADAAQPLQLFKLLNPQG